MIPLLKRLFESQDYPLKLEKHSGETLDYDFSTFREKGIPWGVPLGKLHSDHVGLEPDFSSPWLHVEPNKDMEGKIVIARSPRYNNHYFPWRKLVKQFGPDMRFIGLPTEHSTFCRLFGNVPYFPTNDFYEVASAIQGSDLFIGNQSSPNAICEGLKHPSVQEVCLPIPDCIYPGSKTIYCFDGNLQFEALGKSFKVEYEPPQKKVVRSVSPPGGWKITTEKGVRKSFFFDALLMEVRPLFPDLSITEIEDKIDLDTFEVLPVEELPTLIKNQIEKVKTLFPEYAK